jgi:hypothetical protein
VENSTTSLKITVEQALMKVFWVFGVFVGLDCCLDTVDIQCDRSNKLKSDMQWNTISPKVYKTNE